MSVTPATQLQCFPFEDVQVRIMYRDGNPWFVLADVCRIMGIENPSMAAGRLEPAERATLSQTEGAYINGLAAGGPLPISVSEAGLYRLMMRSDEPEADRFQT